MLVRIGRGGTKYLVDFMTSAVSEWAGSGRKSAGAGPVKSRMYLDPPLHILTGIHLHIVPCPYLIFSAILI